MSSKPVRAREPLQFTDFPYQEIGETPTRTGGEHNSPEDQLLRETLARQAGLRDGEARAKASFDLQLQEARKNIATALDQFARERREYFLAAEREVVQLACSITRKILKRESTLDPLLLAGMVRVALERISQATRVTVRVNPARISDFRAFFAQQMTEHPPEIVEDPSLDPERCSIESELGATEIGPEIQLKEIEQGLLDLQAAKPKSNE